MFSVLRHRRRFRMLFPLAATIATALPGMALASAGHVSIVQPLAAVVSGQFQFTVAGIGSNAVKAIYKIDGHPVWRSDAVVTHSRRLNAVNGYRLANGRHLLAVVVYYMHKRPQVASKRIVVRNPSNAAPSPQKPAGSGSTTSNTGNRTSGGSTSNATAPQFMGATPTAGASIANFNREAYQYVTQFTAAQEAAHHQVMVIPKNEYWLIPQLKAYNPSLKFLMYQATFQTNSDDYSYMPTTNGCVAYQDVASNHPDWFLRDQNGNRVLARGHTDFYLLDVANTAYQQKCVTSATTDAKKYGFDGIFWDIVDGNLGNFLNNSTTVPEYPADASWQAALTSMLAYIGPAVRAQGLISIGNIGDAPNLSTWEQWAGYLDGVEEESWTDGGLGTAQQVPYWSLKLNMLQWAMAHNKYEIVHTYSSTEADNTYGLAAMMLAGNGYASFSTSTVYDNSPGNENWFPEFPLAQSLGAPAAPYRVLANGVYERPFSTGIVLVNPTGKSIPSFNLGGAYSGSGLTSVSSVSMGPTTGLILQKVG